MIAFEFDYVFVASVLLVHLIRVVRLDEFVLLSRSEQSWYKAFFQIILRVQFVNVKISAAHNRFSDQCHSGTN